MLDAPSIISVALYPILVSFFATTILTYLSLPLIRKLKLFDDPLTHKHPAIIHTKPVPRGGGLPFFLGIIVTSALFITFTPKLAAIFAASALALSVGLLDDKYDISPYIRFLMNIVCALIIVTSGTTITFITNPLGGILYLTDVGFPYFSELITLLWIVWVMNMLNWSKGVDGQMPGIVFISGIVIGALSMRFPLSDQNTFVAATMSFILAGSALGFLLFNFSPAKIFPGYGATAVYLLLSVVSILSGAKLATAIMVMGVPMIDGIFTIGRRIISGRSPFLHDNQHLHHLLLRLGFTQRRIALFYWLVSAILGVTSLTLSSRGKLFAIIMISIVIGGGITFLHFLLRDRDEKTRL
ncbi:MAG: undecaprenyl/decaprenyl-phosphate alpha-N-acetylglucosaminyl 1-phosphate transferase [Candidatus Levybacteria bacterium]|nr:undecaprenyl/decaprenyl-phosphate alpha-N-acetylglucosaminyl 1-phosphate transferase [Candidatus Levybacteria bacterium]